MLSCCVCTEDRSYKPDYILTKQAFKALYYQICNSETEGGDSLENPLSEAETLDVHSDWPVPVY